MIPARLAIEIKTILNIGFVAIVDKNHIVGFKLLNFDPKGVVCL
jgi:hypothetical protein